MLVIFDGKIYFHQKTSIDFFCRIFLWKKVLATKRCQCKTIYFGEHKHEKFDEENEDAEDSKERSAYNAEKNDNDSSFDYAQLELDLPDVQEMKDKHADGSETDLKCKKCDYKCKRENTLKKHIKTKHG